MVTCSWVSFLLVPPGRASVFSLHMNVGEMDHEYHPGKTDIQKKKSSRASEMRSRALKGPSTQKHVLWPCTVPGITLLGHSMGLGHSLQEVSSPESSAPLPNNATQTGQLICTKVFMGTVAAVYCYVTNHPECSGLSSHFITSHNSVGSVSGSFVPCHVIWAAIIWGPG